MKPIEVPDWLHVERAVYWLYTRWPPNENDEDDEKVRDFPDVGFN